MGALLTRCLSPPRLVPHDIGPDELRRTRTPRFRPAYKSLDEIYGRHTHAHVFDRRGTPLRNPEPRTHPEPRTQDAVIDELLIGDVICLEGGKPTRLGNLIWPGWDSDLEHPAIPSFQSEYPEFFFNIRTRIHDPEKCLSPGYYWVKEERTTSVDISG
jgi:hypothetical protein